MIDNWIRSDVEANVTSAISGYTNVLGPIESGGYHYACIRHTGALNIQDVELIDAVDGAAVLGLWSDMDLPETELQGVNLCNLDFSMPNLDWFPETSDDEVAYWVNGGATIFRVPVKWNNIQPDLDGEFHASVLRKLKNTVAMCLKRNVKVIIDIHSYGKHTSVKIGGDGGPTQQQYIDFVTKLMKHFWYYKNVMLDTMNEPAYLTAAEWKTISQALITSLRNDGWKGTFILEGGGSFSSAPQWVSSGWAAQALTITDPLDKIIHSPHCYIDSDNSGTNNNIAYEGVGAARLAIPANWARTNGVKLLIGEIGWGEHEDCGPEGAATLAYMKTNSDVFIGMGTYFHAGGGSTNTNPEHVNYKLNMWGTSVFRAHPHIENGSIEERDQAVVLKTAWNN